MDGCALAPALIGLIPSWDHVATGLSVLGSLVITASLVTSLTPTPAAGTRLARVYRVIEIAALLFGRAKQMGQLPATPQVDQALEEALALVRKPQPLPMRPLPMRIEMKGGLSMLRAVLFAVGLGVATVASGCAEPQIVQATDCRNAAVPCGIVIVDHTHAMSNLPVTVPVSALP
jgi:hypothetical protein